MGRREFWWEGGVAVSLFFLVLTGGNFRAFTRQFFNNYWMWIIFFVCVIISIFVTIAVRKKHPWNLVSLGVLTTLEGFLLGVICAMYYSIGWGDTILLALVLTTSVFVFITAFCFATRIDFSFLYAFLAGAIFVVFIAAMAVLVAGWVGAYNKWASFGISVAFALVMVRIGGVPLACDERRVSPPFFNDFLPRLTTCCSTFSTDGIHSLRHVSHPPQTLRRRVHRSGSQPLHRLCVALPRVPWRR